MNPKQEYLTLTKNRRKFEKDLEIYGEEELLKSLKFKTGGMRGVLREGFNGINEVNCNILSTVLAKRYEFFIIGHDTRYKSDTFANLSRRIFKSYNKNVFLFPNIPTPCLSFLVAYFKSDGGLMITASHNPKNYNGFKVYNPLGSQLSDPDDKIIEEEMKKNIITKFSDSENLDEKNSFQYCNEKGSIIRESMSPFFIQELSKDNIFDRNYIINLYVSHLFTNWGPDNTLVFKNIKNKILFTPLYGVSIDPIKVAIKYYGCSDLFTFVEEQCVYDPEFPGLEFPNPEVEKVYDVAKTYEHDLIFSCDPDGDRFGCIERINEEYVHYYGDEIGLLFINFFINNFDHSSLVFINTYLCNDAMEMISKKFNIEYYRTETGFKNISKIVNKLPKDKIVFAYEDSLGFLFGNGCEKDGIKCVVLMGYILQNTLPSKILKEMEIYGTFSTFNFHHRCKDPKSDLEKIIRQLVNVEKVKDMFIIKQEDSKIILRISGTEPIIKVYSSSTKLNKKDLERKMKSFLKKYFKRN